MFKLFVLRYIDQDYRSIYVIIFSPSVKDAQTIVESFFYEEKQIAHFVAIEKTIDAQPAINESIIVGFF